MGESNQEEGRDKAKNEKEFAGGGGYEGKQDEQRGSPRISFGVENRKPAEVAMVGHLTGTAKRSSK
ncbi:MAG: hypothetical protein L6R41_001048 [Letrouitia leprolyta]|nr:MAG: hypothetical protein L6R41_001048 [Letrouitia leprolyta]